MFSKFITWLRRQDAAWTAALAPDVDVLAAEVAEFRERICQIEAKS